MTDSTKNPFGDLGDEATAAPKKRGRPRKDASPHKEAVADLVASGEGALTEADLATIRERAKKIVAEQLRAKQLEDALDKAIAEEKYAAGVPLSGPAPVSAYETVFISLPEFSHALILDGKRYFHGTSPKVSPQVAEFLRYQMQTAWAHEEERLGNSKYAAYRRPRNPVIAPNGAIINQSQQF